MLVLLHLYFRTIFIFSIVGLYFKSKNKVNYLGCLSTSGIFAPSRQKYFNDIKYTCANCVINRIYLGYYTRYTYIYHDFSNFVRIHL